MDLQLRDKVAIVTGGSRGIGQGIAARLVEEGASVVIASRREALLQETARELGEAVTPVRADVTNLDDLDRIVEVTKTKFGRCDILVNNAGTGTYKPFLEVTEEDLNYGMAINFFAQFRLTQRVVPMMMEQGEGVVINISGRTATRTAYPPGSTCTGPAKAAEVRFTTDLALELAPSNIRVVCVIPGVVMTPDRFAKWEREATGRELDNEEAARTRLELARAKLPPGASWGTPEQLADVTAFLASPRASYVNGEAILVDGSPGAYSYVRALYEAESEA